MSESADLDVAYVAQLARLNLTVEETELFQKQLDQVLKYIAKLSEVHPADGQAAAEPTGPFNVFRSDQPRDFLTAEEALANAPRKRDGLFIVPKVVE
jgi:aspartyl-tRNA(Asn)/glutamyl-tRNA(Gln) amidotransferase subunit C